MSTFAIVLLYWLGRTEDVFIHETSFLEQINVDMIHLCLSLL